MGAAFSHGLDFGANIAASQKQHKQDISDLELQSNIGQANDNINGFRAKLSQYAPGSTEHEQAKQGLTQALQARTQLFHPANNPTAMSKFGHMLLDHMPGKQPTAQPVPLNAPTVSATPAMQLGQATLPQGPAHTVQGPQTPQQLKAQAEANLIASSAPTPLPSALTSDETHAAERVKAGLDPRAVAPKAAGATSVLNPKNIVMGGEDGKTPGYYEGDGKFIPLEGHYAPPPPKVGPQSNSALNVTLRSLFPDVTDGRYTEEQLREAMTKPKEWQTPVTSSTHEAAIPDAQGNIHMVTEHSSSHKSFGGTHAPSGSSSPASSPTKIARSGNGASRPAATRTLDFNKATPQSTSAFKAQDTAEAAYNDVKQASADPTPVGDQGIILAWLRGRVNRVTQTEINQVNNLGDAKMKLEGHIARLVSGKMTNQQRAWFLKSAKANYEGAKTVANKYRTPGAMKDAAQANTPSKQMSDDEFLMNLGGK